MRALRIGEWLVDPAANEIRRGAEAVHLEPKVIDLLIALARRHGDVVGRDELLGEVWRGVIVTDDVLTQAVIKLRKALGDTSKEPTYIQTIPKRGYRLIAPVAAAAEETPPAPVVEPDAHVPRDVAAAALRPSWHPQRVSPAGMAGAVALVLALAGGAWYALMQPETPPVDLEASKSALEAAQIDTLPKLIVQPFSAVGSDDTQVLLARGMTARVITDLGRFPDIRVISLQDAVQRSDTSKQTAPGDYVLTGELQRSGDNVRLYARLSAAASGEALWSEQYDRAYGDLFAMQDDLTRRVVEKLHIQVTDAELRRRARPYTRNLQAYEYFLRAQSALVIRRQSDNNHARENFLRAIELDPTFARARAGLALTYSADWRNGWTRDPDGALRKALELATSAEEMDGDIPETHFALAFVSMERGALDVAVRELREALRLDPSYADAYALLGGIETYRGRPQQTIPLMRAAMRLRPESGHLYLLIIGRAHYFLGDADSAVMYLRQAYARNPENVECHVYLAAALAEAGRSDEAAWEADEIRTLEPGFSVARWLVTYPMTDRGQRERLARALRPLGL